MWSRMLESRSERMRHSPQVKTCFSRLVFRLNSLFVSKRESTTAVSTSALISVIRAALFGACDFLAIRFELLAPFLSRPTLAACVDNVLFSSEAIVGRFCAGRRSIIPLGLPPGLGTSTAECEAALSNLISSKLPDVGMSVTRNSVSLGYSYLPLTSA